MGQERGPRPPASPVLGSGPEAPHPPCVPSSGVHLGSRLPSTWCPSFMMLRVHPAPHSPFPGRGSQCPAQTPLTPWPRLCPQKAGSMLSLCPEATSASRPSSQGTCPNHRRQLLPSPPLYPSPTLHQDSWEPRPWSGILPLDDLSLIKWAAAAYRRPVWTPGQLLRGLG